LLLGEVQIAQEGNPLVKMLVELRDILLLAPVGNLTLALELVLHLRHRRLDALDLVEELEGPNLGCLEVDLFFFVEVADDVFDPELALPEALADLQNLSDPHAGVQNHVENLVFALFDALGNLDFALAREE
jgi:hypothetical protein